MECSVANNIVLVEFEYNISMSSFTIELMQEDRRNAAYASQLACLYWNLERKHLAHHLLCVRQPNGAKI